MMFQQFERHSKHDIDTHLAIAVVTNSGVMPLIVLHCSGNPLQNGDYKMLPASRSVLQTSKSVCLCVRACVRACVRLRVCE